MHQEKDRLGEKIAEEKTQINTLESVIALIDEVTEPGNKLSLDRAAACFKELQVCKNFCF